MPTITGLTSYASALSGNELVAADLANGTTVKITTQQVANLASANAATQNAATVYAGPLTGNAASPAFRALGGGDMPKLTINAQTANYTLALADANVAYVRVNSANALVVTVPSNANVAFANGSSILVNRAGAGNVSITSQANVTVNNSSSNTLRAQRSTAALVKVGTDEWDLFGDTT